VDELTTDIILISHLTKKDWVEEHECSNVGMFFKSFKNFNKIFSYILVDNVLCAYPLVESYAEGGSHTRLYTSVHR